MWANRLRNRNGGWQGTRELAANAALRVEPGRYGVVLRAERGLAIVTQTGDPEDHVLAPGKVLRLPRGGLVVAQTLTPARLAVERALAPGALALRVPRRHGLQDTAATLFLIVLIVGFLTQIAIPPSSGHDRRDEFGAGSRAPRNSAAPEKRMAR